MPRAASESSRGVTGTPSTIRARSTWTVPTRLAWSPPEAGSFPETHSWSFPSGQELEIINTGHVSTSGTAAFAVALGLDLPNPFDVHLGAVSGRIDNRGEIETHGDGAAGIVMVGDDHTLTNSGQITTHGGEGEGDFLGLARAAGVLVSGDDALVENTRTGVIESTNDNSPAVELNVLAGFLAANTSSQLRNFGLIRGAEVAVLGGAGDETVVNYGRIEGDVDLGDGADWIVFGRGGTIAGEVLLGGGDDVVRVEDGSGMSHISDFLAGNASGDVVDVSAFFSSFDDLWAHSQQQGGNVVIALDRNDRLVLENVDLDDLNDDDFLIG